MVQDKRAAYGIGVFMTYLSVKQVLVIYILK